MLSSAESFFHVLVKPTVKEFIESPYDVRRGLLAAIVLNHMADHAAMEDCESTDRADMQNSVKRTQNEITDSCPEFTFIRDVADATKHAKLSVPKKNTSQTRNLSGSDDLHSTPGLFHAPFGESCFLEAVSVYATLQDGSSKPLLPSIESVFNAWCLWVENKSTPNHQD